MQTATETDKESLREALSKMGVSPMECLGGSHWCLVEMHTWKLIEVGTFRSELEALTEGPKRIRAKQEPERTPEPGSDEARLQVLHNNGYGLNETAQGVLVVQGKEPVAGPFDDMVAALSAAEAHLTERAAEIESRRIEVRKKGYDIQRPMRGWPKEYEPLGSIGGRAWHIVGDYLLDRGLAITVFSSPAAALSAIEELIAERDREAEAERLAEIQERQRQEACEARKAELRMEGARIPSHLRGIDLEELTGKNDAENDAILKAKCRAIDPWGELRLCVSRKLRPQLAAAFAESAARKGRHSRYINTVEVIRGMRDQLNAQELTTVDVLVVDLADLTAGRPGVELAEVVAVLVEPYVTDLLNRRRQENRATVIVADKPLEAPSGGAE